MGHEAKNVYVKLGLIKPKEQPTARGMLQYGLTEKEIEQEYKYDEFLEQVVDGKEKNFAIVGEPGAGKSTWLEQIALYVNQFTVSLAEPSEKGFPICISLASLGGKTLEDYLLQIWLEDPLPFISNTLEVTPALKNQLKELFSSGKAWLLLDGADEMGRQSNSAPLQTIANQLRGWVDQARVVLTCRLNVWEANPNALPNFETYHTLHFDDEQVGDFIGQWFTQEGKPKLGEKLQNKLGESGNDRILDLIKNPLRLAMLCGIWYFHQGDLPKTKAALYQRYIDDFYQWKPHPLLTDDLDKQEELHTAFSNLALEAIDQKLPLRKKFVHKVMGQSLFQLARDVGWLNWVYKDAETGEDVYAFFHFTFQEYFAACAIDDWRFFLNHDNENPNPLLNPNLSLEYDNGKPAYRIFEPQWKEIILLWLGREVNEEFKNQKEAFIGALLEFKDCCQKLYSRRAYFLAALGIAEFSKHSSAHEIVNKVAMVGCGCFDVEESIAESARIVLLKTDRKLAIEILLDLVKKWEPALWNAAEILSKIGIQYPKVITTLFELIPQIKNESLRKVVANAVMGFDSINLEIQDLGKQNLISVDQEEEKLDFVLTQEDIDFFEQIWTYSDYVLQIVKTNPDQAETILEVINILDYCPSKNHSEGLIVLYINEAIVNNISQQSLILILVKLRKLLFSEKLNKSTESYNYYYEIIWNYAQNIPYPDFYQAWHQTTIHQNG